MIPGHYFSTLLHRTAERADRPATSLPPSRIEQALVDWRTHGHRSIRVLDLACGDGRQLMEALRYARTLGFVSIEGRGVDVAPRLIRHARRAAAMLEHPSTGLVFELAEPIGALAAEHDGAADLILLGEALPYPASPLRRALDRVCAGTILAL